MTMLRCLHQMIAACVVLATVSAVRVAAAEVGWESAVTGARLRGTVIEPAKSDKPLPTVVYLKNLGCPRLGQESDDTILKDLVDGGHLVLVLDYASHFKASGAALGADVLKLRQDITDPKKRSLLKEYKVDDARVFVLLEGFRLKRDVQFAIDDKRVLAMDVMYPSKPATPVPMLIEFSCDNANRMGSSSLLYCRDALLECGQAAGFAVAMADHPVKPPYKGLDDPMPEVLVRAKAAVRAYRALAEEIGGNGKIGAIGFSRGGPIAALLAASNGRSELEGSTTRPYAEVSSDVQAALVHGNRYDYLDLPGDDPMLARFEKAWGPRDANPTKWAAHGAAHYLTPATPPMFLNTSNTESAEFRDGLEKLARRLRRLGVVHVYQVDEDGRGHKVSENPATLKRIYEFLGGHLRS